MKKASAVLLLSLFVVSCSSWDRGKAKTVEQKRDVLLKYGPQYVPSYLSKTPIGIYDLRKQVVDDGGETKEFLNQLVGKCYMSHDDYCAVDEYFTAKEKIDKEKERRNEIPVKKGDLFYCKVKINQTTGPVDSSNIRVGVKDNLDTVGFVFPNGFQIVSPELEVIDSASGERYGRSSDGTKEVGASYDGHSYSITLFDEYAVRQFNGAVITQASKLELAGRIDVWDCKKAK
ncbi:hypothetical protein [Serratia marcescens]|uniref:hypothetical protein n=1 Tax=Serratia marcescens TaxID=615 RepID=UPI003AACFACA